MTCKHTIGLISYPYEGHHPIKDMEQELPPFEGDKITLFNFCPDCGKKLCVIEQRINGKTVLADA